MHRSRIVAVGLACCLVACVGVIWWHETADPVAAVVAGKAISASQLSRSITGPRTPETRRAGLTQLIQVRLLTTIGARYGVTVTNGDVSKALSDAEAGARGAASLTQELAVAGHGPVATPDLIRLQLLRKRVLDALLSDPAVVGSVARSIYFRELPRLERAHLQEIVVESSSTAQMLRGQLSDNPGSFAAAARRYSVDRASAARGGDVGELSRGQLAPAVASAAWASRPGTIEVVRTAYGWLVLRVLSRHAPAYADVSEELVSSVRATAAAGVLTQALAAEAARLPVRINRHIGRWQADAAAVVP